MWILRCFKGDTVTAELIPSSQHSITIGRQGTDSMYNWALIVEAGCEVNLEDKSYDGKGAAAVLEDLQSRFGTNVNGSAMTGRRDLASGDRIILGAAESEPLVMEWVDWSVCLVAEEELARTLTEQFGIVCSQKVDSSTTHFLWSEGEVGEYLLRALAFRTPIYPAEAFRNMTETRRYSRMTAFTRIKIDDDEAGLIDIDLGVNRSALLHGYHFVLRDASLGPVVEALGATASANASSDRTSVNLGHFETDSPTVTLTELLMTVARNDCSALKRIIESQKRKDGKAHSNGALHSTQTTTEVTAPTMRRTVKRAAPPTDEQTKVVVEFANLLRPSAAFAPIPQLTGINYKRFKKARAGRPRNLTCIGVADMVVAKSALESGANETHLEAWLEEERRKRPKATADDGMGQVKRAKVAAAKVVYQPVPVDLAVEEKQAPAKSGAFRSSFFTSIV